IDKALHHRLGSAPIRRYMHAGEIFVTPDDTVEHLQNIMLQERVGQVPVVENGQITGIVTRTDLINLWSQGVESAPQAVNLAEQLADSLPASLLNLLTEAGRVAAEIGSALYIVGGFVRDLLLQKPVFDVDLVVEGDAIALAQAMQARHGGRIRSHRRFGTANWIIEGAVKGIDRLDFVTARTEFYQHPTALPEVEQSSIKQDLHRRDFTINTLAIRLTPAGYGDLLDFYGGYRDLQEGLIRVLHSLSFVEDPTRILRAIRLEQRLGFYLGRRTMEHLQNARDLLKRVTPDRIFSELEYTFNEAKPEKAYRRFSELGVLQTIFPPLQAGDWFAARCVRLRNGRAGTPWETLTPTPAHYFGLLTFPLSAEESSRFVAQLRVRASLQKLLRQIQAVKEAAPTLAQTRRPGRIYTLLTPYQDEALLVCWLAFDDPALQTAFIEFSRTLRHVRPLIDGQYLIEEFGLRPAPLFSRILNRLRDARLDGQVDTLADEHALVAQILEESPPTA
ncbi:MAG: CBS domain-containing protein, partial [Anaerolineae bacterium]